MQDSDRFRTMTPLQMTFSGLALLLLAAVQGIMMKVTHERGAGPLVLILIILGFALLYSIWAIQGYRERRRQP